MSYDSFDDDEFSDSMRAERATRTQSVTSTFSVNQDEDTPATEDSVSLLSTERNIPPTEMDEEAPSGMAAIIKRELKRALEPLSYNVKQLKKQNESLGNQLTKVVQQNESLHKQLKELKSEFSKGPEDLQVLLTGDGIQFLKTMCLRNLDMIARDEDEQALFTMFWAKAKQEGWMIKNTSKAQKDIMQKYREKRNYLKAQIRIRIFEDLVNKTPTRAAKLEKTMKFTKDHIRVAELTADLQRILYNYAYTLIKYCNKNTDVSSLDETEKKIKKKADTNIWRYIMERVEKDRKDKREPSVVKERITRMLDSGITFEPLPSQH